MACLYSYPTHTLPAVSRFLSEVDALGKNLIMIASKDAECQYKEKEEKNHNMQQYACNLIYLPTLNTCSTNKWYVNNPRHFDFAKIFKFHKTCLLNAFILCDCLNEPLPILLQYLFSFSVSLSLHLIVCFDVKSSILILPMRQLAGNFLSASKS